MSPREFWHCLPRRLAVLSQAHADYNTPKDTKSIRTIDGVPVGNETKPLKQPSIGGVGQPDTFIDQL